MIMADYRIPIPFILKWENGWSDDPDDSGGATMKGVTLDTFKEFCKRKGRPEPTKEDLRNISDEGWNSIYKEMFWDTLGADEFNNQNVANIMIDWRWMSGRLAIKRLQLIVGTKDDGIVGPVTLAAVNSKDPLRLFEQIKKCPTQSFCGHCEQVTSQKEIF